MGAGLRPKLGKGPVGKFQPFTDPTRACQPFTDFEPHTKVCCMQVATDVIWSSVNVWCAIRAIQCLQWRTDARSPPSPDLTFAPRMGRTRHMSTCDRDESTWVGPRSSSPVSDAILVFVQKKLVQIQTIKGEQDVSDNGNHRHRQCSTRSVRAMPCREVDARRCQFPQRKHLDTIRHKQVCRG